MLKNTATAHQIVLYRLQVRLDCIELLQSGSVTLPSRRDLLFDPFNSLFMFSDPLQSSFPLLEEILPRSSSSSRSSFHLFNLFPPQVSSTTSPKSNFATEQVFLVYGKNHVKVKVSIKDWRKVKEIIWHLKWKGTCSRQSERWRMMRFMINQLSSNSSIFSCETKFWFSVL